MTRIQDSFTRPNANLPGITSDAWSWVKAAGNDNGYRVLGNQLSRFADQTTAAVYANKVFATNDQFFEFDSIGSFTSGTANANFSCRLNYDFTAGTYYAIQYTPYTGTTAAKLSVLKVGDGAVTSVNVNLNHAATEVFELRGISKRTGTTQTITAYVNGVQVAQMVDATGTPASGKYFGISSYANSARKDAGGSAWLADGLVAGDTQIISRYNFNVYNGTTEIAASLDSIQSGTTSYGSSYVDYIVGESDAKYPSGYNAGYYNS